MQQQFQHMLLLLLLLGVWLMLSAPVISSGLPALRAMQPIKLQLSQ
jgi:hypothetical protein